MKRIVCAFMAVIMIIGLLPPSSTVAIADNSYYQDAVQWARGRGIITGTFSPNQKVTRADVVTVMWKLLDGDPLPRYFDNAKKFTDLNPAKHNLYAIGWAVNHQIASGKTPTTFAPDDYVTYAEAITFLWAAATKTTKPLKAKQTKTALKLYGVIKTGHWYTAPCEWANNQGYLSSIPALGESNSFTPSAHATNATIIYLLWEAYTGEYDHGVVNGRVNKMMQTAMSMDNKPYSAGNSCYQIEDDWCAAFASWCAVEAGLACYGWQGERTDYPVFQTSSCSGLIEHFSNKGEMNVSYYWRGKWNNAVTFNKNFIPRRGDFIFFSDSSTGVQHVGFVTGFEYKDIKTKNVIMIYTIEGNTSQTTRGYADKYVACKWYEVDMANHAKITDSDGGFIGGYIVGFGRVG